MCVSNYSYRIHLNEIQDLVSGKNYYGKTLMRIVCPSVYIQKNLDMYVELPAHYVQHDNKRVLYDMHGIFSFFFKPFVEFKQG